MKSKILFFVTALAIAVLQASHAQTWVGSGITTGWAHRDGDVTIGSGGDRSFKLHVHTSVPNAHVLISGSSPCIRFNEGASGEWNEERANVGLATTSGHYFPSSLAYDFILRANTSTGNILFGNGDGSNGANLATEKMRLASNGNVGIGPLFTSTSQPSRLLHVKGPSASIFVDGTSASPKIEIGYGGIAAHEIFFGAGSGQLKVGPVGTTSKGIHFRQSQGIFFSNDPNFAFSGYQGLSGSYLFDNQMSSTSLLVSPTSLAPYPTIPAGYLFSVKGNSNLNGRVQIENTTDVDPDKSVAGINIGNNLTNIAPAVPYSWIQTQESRPLALNPDPNVNPTTTNTSYVAIGFIPGTYTVPLHYKLAVKGRIICEELKVKYAGQWSDYVFAKEYQLRELQEVEKFIVENKHLPDVPSEAEIKSEGIESGQMDATLLRKIEELTLYMIEQNKKMQEVTSRVGVLEKENAALKSNLSK